MEKESHLEKKSFLRKKWEEFFLFIARKRIAKICNEKNEVLIIKDKFELKEILKEKKIDQKIKFVIITIPLNNFDNLVEFFDKVNSVFPDETKIIANYYSVLWRPLFFVTSKLKITNYFKNECYFSRKIFDVFLQSTNYKISHYIDEPIIPIRIFGVTKLLYLISNIFPFFKFFSVTKICYLQKKNISKNFANKLASIIIPCKNEEKNIEKLIDESVTLKFPHQLVFINDKSDDSTEKVIKNQIEINKDKNIKLISGDGLGKYKAVKTGIKNADGYYCMIFDADITVAVEDLNLFYKAISEGRGNLINGSRLIYKPYAGAMRFLNYFGNIFFAELVSYITNVNVTDTLCGTKCFKKSDVEMFDEFEKINKIFDLWGDFNILFAASYFGLSTIDLPIRYRKREEGETKMKKRFFFFKNMLQSCIKAFVRFKFL
tara:strand:- start:28 stop:1323 length:1296 start_codon:yes stop_codon:yes gene_type:complete